MKNTNKKENIKKESEVEKLDKILPSAIVDSKIIEELKTALHELSKKEALAN